MSGPIINASTPSSSPDEQPDALVPLPPEYRELIEEMRTVLSRLAGLAEKDRLTPVAATAAALLAQLDDLFLAVVVGEVKSGKSAFLNALLGETVCPEGPTPLTDKIHVLRYGATPSESLIEEHVIDRRIPLRLLEGLRLVDTPGTNSLIRQHQEITEDFIPRADLILFVTSIDRPLAESEFQFLKFVEEEWRKKVLFILSKIDTREPEDIEEVERYIVATAAKAFGHHVAVFPVSAKMAAKARRASDAAALEASGIPEVERYVRDRLLGKEAFRLKLLGPAGSAEKLLDDLGHAVKGQRGTLETDFGGVRHFHEQLQSTRQNLSDRLGRITKAIHAVVADAMRRGDVFLLETVRLRKIGLLRNRDRFRDEFSQAALIDLAPQIDQILREAADQLLTDLVTLRERAMSFLADKVTLRTTYGDAIAGGTGLTPMQLRQSEVVSRVRRALEDDLKAAGAAAASERILQEVRRGLGRFFGVEVLSVGVGAGIVLIATPLILDITGIVAALVLSISGFAILPAYRNRARVQFAQRMAELETQLVQACDASFEEAIASGIDSIRSAFEPYLLFFDTERKRMSEREAEIAAVRSSLLELRHRIGKAKLGD